MHRARRIGLIALLALAGTLVAAATGAAGVRIESRPTGAIVIRWHGDPARDCAAHGVCDVRGSMILRPGRTAIEMPDDDDGFHDLDSFPVSGGVVRVLRGPPGDPAGACVDRPADASLDASVEPAGRGRRRLSLGHPDPYSSTTDLLSAGRCAGPRGDDVRRAMPAVTIPAGLLRRRSARLDLSGTRRFHGGPFSGEVVSSVVVRRERARLRGDGLFGEVSGEGPPAPRRAYLDLELEVTAASGTLTTTFDGGPAPACEAFDACGLTGAVTLVPRVTPRSGWLRLSATGPPGALRGRGLRAGIEALRAGRLQLREEPDVTLEGITTGTATRAGSTATCRDRVHGAFPPLRASRRGRRLRLTVKPGDLDLGADPLRTRCPGPSIVDAGPFVPLAAGSVDVRALGRRSVTVGLAARPAGPGAFALGRRGEITVRLRRLRGRAGVERIERFW